jgi:hypothetical protein
VVDPGAVKQQTTKERHIVMTENTEFANLHNEIRELVKDAGVLVIDGSQVLRIPEFGDVLAKARTLGFISGPLPGEAAARKIELLERDLATAKASLAWENSRKPSDLRRLADKKEMQIRCAKIAAGLKIKNPKHPLKGAGHAREMWSFNGHNQLATVILEMVPSNHKTSVTTARRQKGYFSFGMAISPEAAKAFSKILAVLAAAKGGGL